MNAALSCKSPKPFTNSLAVDAYGVSVIIPARNGAATLSTTLLSLVHQTHSNWEAIIVDDGSTDDTRRIAQEWAEEDGRFRVVHQEGLGVSAARNRGLREAKHAYVLFLDSDDQIAPSHLELMTAVLKADPSLDAVHCGWQRILVSGEAGRVHIGSNEADLFPHFAFHCHFAIHACISRRDLALKVGGFDPTLKTCEDWDLFQRIARTGARFGRVPKVLSYYLIRVGSASRDNRRSLIDALAVVDRAYREDTRLGAGVGHRKEPLPFDLRSLAFYNMIVYCAAQEIGAGGDGLDLLNIEDLSPAPGLTAAAVSDGILEALPIGANCLEKDWPDLWCRVSESLSVFLDRLETHSQVPGLAFTTLRNLEQSIVLAKRGENPLLIGNTFRINIELSNVLQDVVLPLNVDRLICRLTLGGKEVGILQLPGFGVLSGERIAEAACEEHSRILLRHVVTPAGYFQLCLKMGCDMARRRTLRLLSHVMTINGEKRRNALKRLKREAVGRLKINLPRIIAEPASPAARKSEQEWREFLDSAAKAGKKDVREAVDHRKPEIVHSKRISTTTPAAEEFSGWRDLSPGDASQSSCSVPILMYHRIAAEGPPQLARYRTAPELFQSQIAALHRAGYRTIRLMQWVKALAEGVPIPEKPIILTFDDGYKDYLTAAIPVLHLYGFSASVFLVAQQIGKSATWDSASGPSAPLLSWDEIRALQEVGVEFGCHSSVHRPATGMSLKELAQDMMYARGLLEEGLGHPVTTLAYPYGAINEYVLRVMKRVGFSACLTCEPGLSKHGDDPWRLPRLEVRGGCSADQLIALIESSE